MRHKNKQLFMKKVYLLLLTAIITAASFAQAVLIAGNPGTSGLIVVGQMNYHVSESIYTDAEIGPGNYTTAGSAIQQIFFLMNNEGLNSTINNYRIYMKNVPAATLTLPTGAYTTVGYTQVFNGTYVASPVGFTPIILTTPFVRTAGSNLQILIERVDNTVHTGASFDAATGNNTSDAVLSSRRYNGNVAPVSGATVLTETNFRPAIVLNHTFPVDAAINDIFVPSISCFSSPQTIDVEVFNAGTVDIAPGAASVTLRVRGANTFTGTQTNTQAIVPGQSGIVSFAAVNLNNPGLNFDTAFVTVPLDGTTFNDTLSTVNNTATTLSTFPLVEDVETTLPVFSYAEPIVAEQLWGIWDGPYSNADQTTALAPRAPGNSAYIFDSYSGASSLGFESRLFSNCINLSSVGSPTVSFYMSHDNIFPNDADSLYVSISTDQGVTWTRLEGFRRPDATAIIPQWQLHSVSLANFTNQTVQLAFEGVSKYGNAILLDDITISGILPVSLMSFEAQRNGRVNNLSWKTAQELNSKHFAIERSTDGGQKFIAIGQVAAAGNSTTERNYNFIDENPVKGYNYYRLRIVDLDNSEKFSIVRNVRNIGTVDVLIAPNPVGETLKLRVDAEKAGYGTLVINDYSGRQVSQRKVTVLEGSNNVEVATSSLPAGAYIATIQLNNEKITRKFTKQ